MQGILKRRASIVYKICSPGGAPMVEAFAVGRAVRRERKVMKEIRNGIELEDGPRCGQPAVPAQFQYPQRNDMRELTC
jgi:hypothetical protein